jgi:hypothetical protein
LYHSNYHNELWLGYQYFCSHTHTFPSDRLPLASLDLKPLPIGLSIISNGMYRSN